VTPCGVATVICPEPVPPGTAAVRLVTVEAAVGENATLLNSTRLFAAAESKFVPVMVTDVPAIPIEGVKPVIVGAPVGAPTTKAAELVAVPRGLVTVIGPVVAPAGTEVTNWLMVADVTGAAVPLNCTVFCDGVGLNPVP